MKTMFNDLTFGTDLMYSAQSIALHTVSKSSFKGLKSGRMSWSVTIRG